MSGAARMSNVHVHVALARKEWRESTPALIAGGAIYVALPLVLSSVYRIFDPHHEPLPGVAMTLWILTGWLFAAVLGAQIVCRDFGRAEGVFLLAQPVKPASVVWVKGLVGLKLILLLAIASLLFESAVSNDLMPTMILTPMFGVAIAAAVVSYGIAFLAATIVRRALPALMLGVLSLVLMAVLPLLSSRTFGAVPYAAYYAFPEPLSSPTMGTLVGTPDALGLLAALGVVVLITPVGTERFRLTRLVLAAAGWTLLAFLSLDMLLMASVASANLWIPSFVKNPSFATNAAALLAPVVVAVIFGGVIAGAAMLAARAERGVAVRGKTLAWAVTLLMMALSLVSINEVGADVPVRATYWHEFGGDGSQLRVDASTAARMFRADDNVIQIQTYGLGPDGEVQPGDLVPLKTWPAEAMPLPNPPVWYETVHSGAGYLFAEEMRFQDTSEARTRPILLLGPAATPHVLSLHATHGPGWKDGERTQPTLLERRLLLRSAGGGRPVELPLPKFPESDPPPYLVDAVWQNNLLIVLFDYGHKESNFWTSLSVRLLRYDMSDPLVPRIESQLDLDYSDGWTATAGGVAFATDNLQTADAAFGSRFVHGADGRLYVTTTDDWYSQAAAMAGGYPMVDPMRLDQGLSKFPHMSRTAGSAASAVALVPGRVVLDESHCAAVDQWGLYIIRAPRRRIDVPPPTTQSVWALPAADALPTTIGTRLASPLAWLFRSQSPRLLAGGSDLLLEIHQDSVVAYDIRDYARPRRVAHVRSPRVYDAQVAGGWLYLDHRDGFSVVALADIRRKMTR